MRYQDINAYIFDRWAEEGWQSSRPLNHQNYQNAALGNWQIRLTPGRYVPRDWFPPLQGLQVLGLASGGGQQMPVTTVWSRSGSIMRSGPSGRICPSLFPLKTSPLT